MIIKLKEFLITENIKQMREYLAANGLSNMESKLSFIKDKFVKKPNFIYIFTKMMVSDDGKIHGTEAQFNDVADWMLNKAHLANKLPKGIHDYTSIEELQDDIKRVETAHLCDKFYGSLYRSMKDKIERLSTNVKNELDATVIEFMLLPDDIRKQFPPLKYFEANSLSIGDFINAITNFVKNGSVNSSRAGVLSVVEKTTDAKIVYDSENVLLIQSNNRELIIKLGSQRWCIVYAPDSYFDEYVGGENLGTQYLLFNFNLPQSHRYSLLGISIDINDEPMYGGCQDRENSYFNLDHIYKTTGIQKEMFDNIFMDIIKEISSSENIFHKVIEISSIHSTETLEALLSNEEFTTLASKSIAVELEKTANLFSDGFDSSVFFEPLGDSFYIDNQSLAILILICVMDAIPKEDTDMLNVLKEVVMDSNIKVDDLEKFIPGEDDVDDNSFYNFPDKFASYGRIIELLNVRKGWDNTAFEFVAYTNTPPGTDINNHYKDLIKKKLDLNEDMVSEIKLSGYGDLGQYFDGDLDLEDIGDHFYHEGTDNDWEYCMTDLNISSILKIYKYYADNDLIEIQEENYNLYNVDEFLKMNLYESNKIYRDEAHVALKYLKQSVEDAIEAEDDSYDGVKRVLGRSAMDATESKSSDEFYKNLDDKLSDIFQYHKDGKNVTKWIEGNIVLLFDAFYMLEKVGLVEVIDYAGIDFDSSDIINTYINEHGSLRYPSDDNYTSYDDDYFNERVLHNMDQVNEL